MEQIAEQAVVSTGSLYNYFPSKHALLLAVWSRRASAALATVEERIGSVDSAAEKCAELLLIFAEVVGTFETPVTREVLASALSSPHLELEGYIAIDMALLARLEALVAELRYSGQIAAEVSPRPAAALLYGAVMMQVMAGVAAPHHFDMERARTAIATQVDLAFRGLTA